MTPKFTRLKELKRQAQKSINSHSLMHLSPVTILALIKAVEALERIQANPLGSNMDDAIARQALEAIEKQIEKEE